MDDGFRYCCMSADELYESGNSSMNTRTGPALMTKYGTLAISITLRPNEAVITIQHRPSRYGRRIEVVLRVC